MNLPRIPAGPPSEPLTSGDLVRLAQVLSERLRMTCPSCRTSLKLSLPSGNLKLGTSPNLTGVDDSQSGFPRLVLWCTICQKSLGFVQADLWQWDEGALKKPGDTRWDHLEFDDLEGESTR